MFRYHFIFIFNATHFTPPATPQTPPHKHHQKRRTESSADPAKQLPTRRRQHPSPTLDFHSRFKLQINQALQQIHVNFRRFNAHFQKKQVLFQQAHLKIIQQPKEHQLYTGILSKKKSFLY